MNSIQAYQRYFMCFVIGLLVVMVTYRAATLSMTHDESSTYISYHAVSIWECFTNIELWQTANNHLLNTLLFQISIKLFGQSDFALRLPNVLAFLLYAYCAYRLIHLVFQQYTTQLLAFVLLFLNSYMLDFFSLSRGYGLSLAFQMWALYNFALFFQQKRPHLLLGTYLALLLATLALFTNLILIPAFTAALWLFHILQQRAEKVPIRKAVFGIPILFASITLALVYTPMKGLTLFNEFQWGVSSLSESLSSLTNNTFREHKFFGQHSKEIFYYLTLLPLVGGILLAFRTNAMTFHRFLAFAFFLMLGTLVMSFVLLGSQYPDQRKTLMFIPTIALLICFFVERSPSFKYKTWLTYTLSLFFIYAFLTVMRMDATREWWYDAQTASFIEQINAESKGEKVSLGCHWHFHHTSHYYILTKDYKHIELAAYSKDLPSTQSYDFFISMKSDFDKLEESYVLPNDKKARYALIRQR